MSLKYIKIPKGYIYEKGTNGIDYFVRKSTGLRIAINGEDGFLPLQNNAASNEPITLNDKKASSLDVNGVVLLELLAKHVNSCNSSYKHTTLFVSIIILTMMALIEIFKPIDPRDISVTTWCPDEDSDILEYSPPGWGKIVNGKVKNQYLAQIAGRSSVRQRMPKGPRREKLNNAYTERVGERMQCGDKITFT